MTTKIIPEKITAAEERKLVESQVGLLTREEVARVEKEVAAILAPAAPAAAPALPKRESLLAFIVRPVLAFLDGISGPAMTARDRDARDLAESRHHRGAGLAGF